MTDSHPASSAGRFDVRVTADSHFAWVRTRLSLERTMMSWQRTAVALMGLGFAIVQCRAGPLLSLGREFSAGPYDMGLRPVGGVHQRG